MRIIGAGVSCDGISRVLHKAYDTDERLEDEVHEEVGMRWGKGWRCCCRCLATTQHQQIRLVSLSLPLSRSRFVCCSCSLCHGSWALPKHRHRTTLTRRHGKSSSGGGRRIPIIISRTLSSMSCASCVSVPSPFELLTTLTNICRSEATAESDFTPLYGAACHSAPRGHRYLSRGLLLPPRG
jgi:hypothetical protein